MSRPRTTTGAREGRRGAQTKTGANLTRLGRKTTGDTDGAPSRALLFVLGALTEKQFQRTVVNGLRQRGYLVWVVPDMRKTLAGLPDVIAVHPTRVPRRVLFYELKTQTGRVRPAQKDALAALAGIPGIDARIVRPSDWPALSDQLDIEPRPSASGAGDAGED